MNDKILNWGSYRIATVWGIPIRLNISLLFFLPIFIRHYGWLNGAILQFCFIVGIILHELGHSYVAQKKGCRVRDITMTCIGGAARMEQIPSKPLDEFMMAIAGPAVSLVIGITCIITGGFLNLPAQVIFKTAEGYVAQNIIQFVGWINIVWVVFNLIPAFPMDGGRVLRAMLVPRFGRLRATLWASRVGRVLAVFGILTGLKESNPVLILISMYIFHLAGQEYKYVAIQESMKQKWSPFDGWKAFTSSSADKEEPADSDEVIISPPPYEKGPNRHARIKPLDDNPFNNLFG